MPSNSRRTPRGPRIYNLFPTLLGPVERWSEQLPQIARMGFNWVFVNPFHLPGESASLYAVKDYYRLNPALRSDGSASDDELLADFIAAADRSGIAVMMDLVVNHTAYDADLIAEHPEWYVHDDEGSIRSPSATDLEDPEIVTVWEDLAELDYSERPERDQMIGYFADVIRHYTDLGFRGFRCDAAYQLPGEVWQELIERARDAAPNTRFFAETLGAPPEDIEQLRPAGFDYLFNSAKWWDFRADWLLDQYRTFRDLAPSIAFPESHDTPRLAEESGGDIGESRFWYLFAAVFSSGVMMPIGYEFGFRRELHVVETRPQHWEEPSFDIRDFIARVNALKQDTAVLNEEGPQERFTEPSQPVVGLLRRCEQSAERCATLINPEFDDEQEYAQDKLAAALECRPDALVEITPEAEPATESDSNGRGESAQIRLSPRSLRVFIVGE